LETRDTADLEICATAPRKIELRQSKQTFSDPANPVSSRFFPVSSQENAVSSQFNGAVALPGGQWGHH